MIRKIMLRYADWLEWVLGPKRADSVWWGVPAMATVMLLHYGLVIGVIALVAAIPTFAFDPIVPYRSAIACVGLGMLVTLLLYD
jgi:hypothetical protein